MSVAAGNSGLNANDPFEDTETVGVAGGEHDQALVSMPTIRSRILKRNVLTGLSYTRVSLNANDPFEDTETDGVHVEFSIVSWVSMPTIRSRILKHQKGGVGKTTTAVSLNANDPFEDTETLAQQRLAGVQVLSQCQRSVRGY